MTMEKLKKRCSLNGCVLVLPKVIRYFALTASNQIIALALNLEINNDPTETAHAVALYLVNFYKSLGIKILQETFKEKDIHETNKSFASKMIPVILNDFNSKKWLSPIHTGDYHTKISKVCDMIFNKK